MTEQQLRSEVREFIAEQVAEHGTQLACDSWLSGFSPEFSRAQARRGWLGMTWPKRYGGHERSERDRWIVNEELLAAGAPVAAHWIGDRQSGPSILKNGTEAQRESFLPAIAAGEIFFGIGMSESESGSDLASVRTTANRAEDGTWRLNGSKLWTSGAHRVDYAIALVRTSPVDSAARHTGLSQFIVDLRAPGISIHPIRTLEGQHHFNEVLFDNVVLTDADLLGEQGAGWRQCTSELAFERSGSERFLSTFPLLSELATRLGEPTVELGVMVAEIATLRAMSGAVAEALGRGESPATDAAMVKDLGTRLEVRVIDLVRRLAPQEIDPDSEDVLQRHLAQATTHAPGFTLRGGTNEILRGIVARELVS